MNLNMSSGSLQATSTPYLPLSHTGSVPQGMLWMRGSWINMEALTPVNLLQQASHQQHKSRWKNLWRFYDFQLPGGSDIKPHRETGEGGREVEKRVVVVGVGAHFLCYTQLPFSPPTFTVRCLWSTNVMNFYPLKAQLCLFLCYSTSSTIYKQITYIAI